ncbi:hypothetical protein [Pedobacter frigoris]|uniref:hypothetical protein n=1 Tax=Pedobacter frigoris TaxID=2571272 RepID=UPI00292D7B10|nr:hypothetical protein [Pedobacter frigoris]
MQQDRPVCRKPQPAQGCSRSITGKTAKRAVSTFAADFLKDHFPPLSEETEILCKQQQVESVFFSQIRYFADRYNFIIPKVDMVVYPYNIYLVMQEANQFLSSKKIEDRLYLIESSEGNICLLTASTFNTSGTVYYFPLKSLWTLSLSKKHKQEYRLLLSVFAYCYQVLKMPYYNGCHHVGYYYEAMEEGLECNEEGLDKEYQKECLAEIRLAYQAGRELETHILKPCQLKGWQRRLDRFNIYTPFGRALYQLALNFYDLYQHFPEKSFHENIYCGLIEPDAENRLYPDQYISFVWSNDGQLAEDLYNYFNCDADEAQVVEEPLKITLYDKAQGTQLSDLRFETRLFELFGELADMLQMIEDSEHLKTIEDERND